MNDKEGSPNIYQRINAVMKKVKYIKKDANVSGYKAVTHDKVVAECRSALIDEGVVIYPEQLSHSMPIMRDVEKNIKMHLYSADYAIHFVNIDNPDDRIIVNINAHANDNGDKSPGKAVTYATKTAILKVLCLETGENDESRVADKETLTPDQVEIINKELGDDDDLKKRMLASLCVKKVEDIYSVNFNQSVKNLKKAKKAATS